jgi:hypothetical protein
MKFNAFLIKFCKLFLGKSSILHDVASCIFAVRQRNKYLGDETIRKGLIFHDKLSMELRDDVVSPAVFCQASCRQRLMIGRIGSEL